MALITYFGHFLRMPLTGGFEARRGDHLEFHSGKTCGEHFGKQRHDFSVRRGVLSCGRSILQAG